MDDPSEPLYDLPPAEFTAVRDALAKQLRADKQRDEAARIKALRRPSVPAWAVNQVARRHPQVIEDLVAAGAALATSQRRALSGIKDSGMRAAGQQRREAVERAWATAEEILRAGGSDPTPHRQPVTDTFEAVAADEDAADAVRAGRLAVALPPPSGFGDVFGLGLVSAVEPSPADESDESDVEEGDEKPAPADPTEAQRAARRAAEDARRRADQAAEEADRAQRAGGDARQSAVRAAAEAQRLEERAATARTRAEELAAKADDAEARAAAAQAHADELAALAEQAAAEV